MSINLGTLDRGLRAALGIALLLAAIFAGLSQGLTIGAAVIGLVLLGTASIKFCPLYAVVGLKTCKEC